MPTLINNIQDKQFKTAFKKQYSVVSQALQMIYAKDGETLQLVEINQETWTDMDIHFCRLAEELNAVKKGIDCNTMTITDTISWHDENKWYNKKREPQFLNNAYRKRTFILADGTMLNFNCWNNIYVDVNGFKGPNTIGRDIFQLRLSQNSTTLKYSFPYGTNLCTSNANTTITENNYEEDCKNGTGWGCSPLYILE